MGASKRHQLSIGLEFMVRQTIWLHNRKSKDKILSQKNVKLFIFDVSVLPSQVLQIRSLTFKSFRKLQEGTGISLSFMHLAFIRRHPSTFKNFKDLHHT